MIPFEADARRRVVFSRPKNLRFLAVIGALVMLAVLLASGKTMSADRTARILHISSYSPSFHSFFKQINGLKAGLKENGYPEKRYVLDVEFLDSKRFPFDEIAQRFEQALSYKLKNLPPYDVVVVGDDNALNFAKDKQATLFRGSKIVFLGVNSLKLALAQNQNPDIVGVVERRSVVETLSLAARLFSGKGPIHVITDNTPTGRINRRQLNQLLNIRPDLTVEWHYLGEMTYGQLFARLKALPNTGPLFLSTGARDVNGTHLNTIDFYSRLKEVYAGPIFTVQKPAIGIGALGGKIVSHFEQGREAARLATEILKGVSSNNLRVVTESPNVFVFDYKELRRLGVNESNLPPGSQIIGAPESLVGKYFYWIVAGAILISIQSMFILLLVLNMRKRQLAEKSLHETEARFRAFFDNSPSVMYIKDRDQKLSYVNARYLDQYNVAAKEVLGKKGGSKLTDAQKAAVDKLDRSVVEQRVTVSDTVPMISPEGRTTHFYITKFPVYGADGEVTGIGGINTDVTELHDREVELEDAKAQAEQAAAQADAANKTKSTFLATMSHEIRTPMNGVLGTADLLSRTSLTSEQREFVDIMKESGQSLLELLNDILDLSKIEMGNVQLEELDFSVEDLLTATKNLWGHIAGDKGLAFLVDNQVANNRVVRSDRNRIRQVINNLVGNAIKFTTEGQVKISVTETHLDDQMVRLRFEISDTGIGISHDHQSKIFEPFTQADSSTTRHFGGTGLGLAVCKQLSTLLGGDIGVESTADLGSTFWFTVQARCVDQQRVDEDKPQLPASQGDSQANRNLHVLIAEDNKLNQRIIAWMLAPLQCQTDIVESGREAIAAAVRSPYDLILMDVQMPEMDGVTATKKIRSLDGPNKDIPIVAMTANAMLGDREKYLSEGMTDYVSKPIDQRELLATVARRAGVAMPEFDEAASIAKPSGHQTQQATPSDTGEMDKLVGDLDDLLDGTER